MTDQANRLELRYEGPDGYRHYLDGSPVHAGDTLELWKDGQWILGRYEWTYRSEEAPAFYISDDNGVFLTPDAALRWPK